MEELKILMFKFISACIVMIVHEFVKSVTAYFVTHPIYRQESKISTKVLKYIDPLGIFMFVFTMAGWQYPSEYNPQKFSDRKKGILAVALSGLLSNLLFMTMLIPVYFIISNSSLQQFIFILIYFNFALTIINCLPIPPFDMAKIISAFSPSTYFKLIQNQRIIHVVFILLLVMNIIPAIISVLLNPIIYLLQGVVV